MRPRDRSNGAERGQWILRLPPCTFKTQTSPANSQGCARTGTYPSSPKGRTHSTPGPAGRTRSPLAAAASLASCELCVAGGTPRAPSRSAGVQSLGGEESELLRAGGARRSAAPPGLDRLARSSGPARVVDTGGAGWSEVESRGAAEPVLRVPRAACALRAPWLGSVSRRRWRRRWNRGTGGLQGWRNPGAEAATCWLSLCLLVQPDLGEHSVCPRVLHCPKHPPSPSLETGEALLSQGEVGWTRGTGDPGLRVSKMWVLLGGEPGPGTFSPAAAPTFLRGPGTSLHLRSRPLSPFPCTWSPPPGRTPPVRAASSSPPGEAQLLTNIIALLLPLFSSSTPRGSPKSPGSAPWRRLCREEER